MSDDTWRKPDLLKKEIPSHGQLVYKVEANIVDQEVAEASLEHVVAYDL
jgi:hypothetical protein